MCEILIGINIILLLFIIVIICRINRNKIRAIYIQKPIRVYSNSNSNFESEGNDKFMDKNGKPNVMLLGSIHGNEPAGHHALNSMIKDNEFDKRRDNSNFYVIANPNEYGIKNNKRNSPWGDLNRSFPREYGPLFDNGLNTGSDTEHPIKIILPYINNANFIIDVHEAYGYYGCNNRSLGNTIYISDDKYKDEMQKIVNKLNDKLNYKVKCKKWTILTELPETNANTGITLDEYIKIIPEDKRPLYILIEVAGQRDIQPLEKRVKITKFLINEFLDFYAQIYAQI